MDYRLQSLSLPTEMKRIQQNIMRYGLLLASLVMLMSVIVPHHHHEDGRPCCISLTEQGEDPDDEHESTHDRGCEGHNLAVLSNNTSSSHGGDLHLFWVPLMTLFEYIYPELALLHQSVSRGQEPVYLESLHGVWIADAVGLRAPPCLLA